MKQFILLILIMFSVNAFNANYLDSLFAIIKSPSHSDSIKLVTYERITKQLIKTSLDSCRLICNEGLKFSDSIKNYRFKWSFYNRIGRTYHYEARYPEAINYFIKSLNVAETAQDTFTIAQTMNNLGIIYEESGDLEKALQYYNKSVEFKLKLKKQDLYSIAMTKMYAGMVYLKSDEYDKAEKIFKDVLETTEKIEDKTKKFRIYSNIGTYHAYLGSRNNNDRLIFEALKYFFLAETEIDASENSAEKFKILYQIAEAYFVLNDTENGFNNIEKARFIAKELNDLKNFEYIYLVLHNFYFNQENYKMAYYYKDSVEQIRDSIDYSERLTAIAEIETKYQTEKNKKENLELRQKNERQERINNIFLISIIIAILLGFVFSYLFSKLRLKNQELIKKKKELENLNIDLKISNEQTEQALEFKSLFLANMSHEIRTPLNIIIGFNSILKKSIADRKLIKYIESIETSSYNLLRFLNDILDMSKLEAGKVQLNPENINLKLLISNIKELFSMKAEEKDIFLNVEFDDNVPDDVIIDEIRLRQILVNLIGNAIKFTEIGSVIIKVEAPLLNKYQSEFSTTTNLRIHIEDTGIGISKEDLGKIFESFRQVNIKEQKQLGGTGLGLAISKRLTEMMQGEISVISEKGKGSTFSVTLRDIPIGRANPGSKQENKPLTGDLSFEFTGGTILVADDEDMNRSLIKVCFEKTKVIVLEAANGKETIEIARKVKPEIILMDVKMPVIDGLEATKIIKQDESLKHIHIIAFSASNIFERLDDDEINLFSGLISKPVLLDELYQKTAAILPHKNKTDQVAEKQPDEFLAANFTDDLGQKPQQVKDKLSVEFKEKFSSVFGTNSMKKILDFTDEIKIFASENHLNRLENYAQLLRNAGENFDIEQIKKLLKIFPEIIQNTKY